MSRLALGLACVLALAACGHEDRPEPATSSTCVSAASSTDASKAVAMRFLNEVFGKKDPDAVLGIAAPDLVNHAAIPEAQGAEGMRTIVRKLLAAFPDLTMKVEDVVADGDRVVVRALFEGTQTGALEFKEPLPATGKPMRIVQMHTFRVKGGKVVEMWMTMDRLELTKQLGVSPGPRREGGS